jgi:predicted small secreted protein
VTVADVVFSALIAACMTLAGAGILRALKEWQ